MSPFYDYCLEDLHDSHSIIQAKLKRWSGSYGADHAAECRKLELLDAELKRRRA